MNLIIVELIILLISSRKDFFTLRIVPVGWAWNMLTVSPADVCDPSPQKGVFCYDIKWHQK